MGLYPPGAGDVKLTEGENAALMKGLSLPQMRIRNADAMNNDLKLDALPHGFI